MAAERQLDPTAARHDHAEAVDVDGDGVELLAVEARDPRAKVRLVDEHQSGTARLDVDLDALPALAIRDDARRRGDEVHRRDFGTALESRDRLVDASRADRARHDPRIGTEGDGEVTIAGEAEAIDDDAAQRRRHPVAGTEDRVARSSDRAEDRLIA